MTGIVCALSPARLKILEDDPQIAHDLADRTVKVPGRFFFDALRMPERLRGWLPQGSDFIFDCLDGKVGRGVGDRDGWAFSRPHVIESDDLAKLGAALASVEPPDEEGEADLDGVFLQQLSELVRQELERGGALLVFIT